MTSEVSICNRAIQIIGGDDSIISLTEDSRLARACNAVYETTRDTEQAKYFWKFCKHRVVLAPDVDTPVFGFAVQYSLPTDLLRVPKPNDYLNDWQFEADKLLTNRDTTFINLIYQRKISDPTKFPALFSEALAARIAFNIGEQITNSSTKAEAAMKLYKETISEARRLDAFWTPDRAPVDDEWVVETR